MSRAVQPTLATVAVEVPEAQVDTRVIVREFFLNTSAHALPGIARSKSIHNRVFWSISFVAFTGIMSFFVTRAIMDYFEYPTKFNTDFAEEFPQYFPAFSLCSASPLRLDKVLEPYLNYTRSLNLSISNDTTSWTARDASYVLNFIARKLNRNESLLEYYFPLSSLMYSCTFNAMPCSPANFTSFNSPAYGLCYTFNAKMKNSNDVVRYANDNGGDGTLDLSFYIHLHQHVPFLRDGSLHWLY